MDFVKSNLFKFFNDEYPIGLSSLGLKKCIKKSDRTVSKKKAVYPKFFKFDKVAPVGI